MQTSACQDHHELQHIHHHHVNGGRLSSHLQTNEGTKKPKKSKQTNKPNKNNKMLLKTFEHEMRQDETKLISLKQNNNKIK